MKKSVYSIAILLAACACTKEADQAQQPENIGGITFSATMDVTGDTDTKAHIGDDNTIVWSAGDSISVLDVNNYPSDSKFVLASGAGKTTASFPGTCPLSTTGYYAVYPYSANTYLDRNTSNPDIFWDGSTQTAYDGQLDPAKHLMVAYAEAPAEGSEVSLAFRNVLAYLKFTIEYRCKSVTIQTGSADDYIACKDLEVKMDSEGNPSVSTVTTRTDRITLTSVGGAAVEPGTYYVGILPRTYSQGFTVTFASEGSSDRNVMKSKETSCTFERSKVYDLGTIDIASATSLDGEGTKNSPYLIRNYNDLKTMSYLVNNNVENYASAYYRQVNDIDCASKTLTPIGTSTSYFWGIYDGQNHTITKPKYDALFHGLFKYNAMFGFIKHAIIQNLNIKDPEFNISDGGVYYRTISPLVAYALSEDGTNQITGCKILSGSYTISGIHDLYYGGIVAFNESDIVITDCQHSPNVYVNAQCETWGRYTYDDGYKQYIGGIIGYTSGAKHSDPARNEATDDAYTYVNRCRNTGNLTIGYALGQAYLGGIIGMCQDSNGESTITTVDGDVCARIGSCVNSGEMTIQGTTKWDKCNSYMYMGGIVGYMDSDGFMSGLTTVAPMLSCCLFKGTMITGWYYYVVGGIIGYTYNVTTEISYCVNAGHDSCAKIPGLEHYQYAMTRILNGTTFKKIDDYTAPYCYTKEAWYTNNNYCALKPGLTAEDMNEVTGSLATWTGKMSDCSLDIVF